MLAGQKADRARNPLPEMSWNAEARPMTLLLSEEVIQEKDAHERQVPDVPFTPSTLSVMPTLDTESDTETSASSIDGDDGSAALPSLCRRVVLQVVVLTSCGMAYQMALGMCMPLCTSPTGIASILPTRVRSQL